MREPPAEDRRRTRARAVVAFSTGGTRAIAWVIARNLSVYGDEAHGSRSVRMTLNGVGWYVGAG